MDRRKRSESTSSTEALNLRPTNRAHLATDAETKFLTTFNTHFSGTTTTATTTTRIGNTGASTDSNRFHTMEHLHTSYINLTDGRRRCQEARRLRKSFTKPPFLQDCNRNYCKRSTFVVSKTININQKIRYNFAMFDNVIKQITIYRVRRDQILPTKSKFETAFFCLLWTQYDLH